MFRGEHGLLGALCHRCPEAYVEVDPRADIKILSPDAHSVHDARMGRISNLTNDSCFICFELKGDTIKHQTTGFILRTFLVGHFQFNFCKSERWCQGSYPRQNLCSCAPCVGSTHWAGSADPDVFFCEKPGHCTALLW